MSDLHQFRQHVTRYRKRKRHADGRQYTQENLAEVIGLSADELGHRLRGNGKLPLSQDNILAIVLALAEWETLTWDEAVELLTWMDYPLDQPYWRAKLQRVLAPPPPQVVPHSSGAGPQPVHRPFQARKLPEGYIARPNVFEAVKQLLLTHEGSQTTAITTALRGAGGFGKTTLALALCHDPDIQAAFPDGILWMELGEHPPRPLDVLNGVLHSLDASLSGAITLEEARENFRTALQERVCLLVIDDVWQAETLEPLLEGGPRCVRLVTTRNDHVLPEKAARIFVDAMEPAEAIAVLCHNLPEEIQQAVYQSQLQALVMRLGCWPLLLTLTSGMLATWVRNGKTLVQTLSIVEQAYQKRGVVAFHLASASERQRTAEACLDVSLRHLEEFTPTHYHATERYRELAIFPEDTDIPLTMLQTYWQGTGALEDWETEDLCSRLHGLSLLLHCDLGIGTIRLHDVVRSYLIQRASSNLPALHGRLLDMYQQEYGLTRWADLPPSQAYLWQYLIFHLYWAGRLGALQDTLNDLGYLARKALYVSVSALEADLAFASIWLPAQMAFPPVTKLYLSIMQISHLLRQARTEAEMGGVLLSYLPEELSTASQRRMLESELPRPFLVSQSPLHNYQASSALQRSLTGHMGWVLDCAVSPDGDFIVSASDDRMLKVWNTAAGTERLTLRGHTAPVTGCAVSPDGQWIVSASYDKTLKMWDAATGIELRTLTGHDYMGVLDCAVSPDGSFIVSASRDCTLKIWNTATGTERLTLRGHTAPVTGCAVSPDGQWIVSASYDKTLKVWDTATGIELRTLVGHTKRVTDCAIGVDGNSIVSASEDHTLKVWDATTGTERLTLRGHTSDVTGCAISPDGRFIVSASSDKTLKVWDPTTGVEQFTLRSHTHKITGCTISPDGRFIVSASLDHTLKVWDSAAGTQRHTFSSSHTGSIRSCAISPDGRFAVSASDNCTLTVWSAAKPFTLRGHTGPVNDCAVSPDGRFIVSASNDRTLKMWDAYTRHELRTLRGHYAPVTCCVIDPDSRFIVSGSVYGSLKVWDAVTGWQKFDLIGHYAPVTDCAVSPDGCFIISASVDGTLKVWNATGKERLTLRGHTDWVLGCAVSPDGHFIVSASGDCTLKVWDAATGIELRTLVGHTKRVYGCAVSPDGRFIVSAAWDHTLKVWDTVTEQCLLTFPFDSGLSACVFHPNGKQLVVCGNMWIYFLRLVV